MRMMKIAHFNVGTRNLAETVDFYTRVVGLESGARPNFASTGAWMYSGTEPLVHLVELPDASVGDTGPIDHIALELVGLDEFMAHLEAQGEAFHHQPIPDDEGWQVFVVDPNGVKLEFNFLDEFVQDSQQQK